MGISTDPRITAPTRPHCSLGFHTDVQSSPRPKRRCSCISSIIPGMLLLRVRQRQQLLLLTLLQLLLAPATICQAWVVHRIQPTRVSSVSSSGTLSPPTSPPRHGWNNNNNKWITTTRTSSVSVSTSASMAVASGGSTSWRQPPPPTTGEVRMPRWSSQRVRGGGWSAITRPRSLLRLRASSGDGSDDGLDDHDVDHRGPTATAAISTVVPGVNNNNNKVATTMVYDSKKIRNFSIIAHIDHGKSTLADRLLETTHTVSARDMEEQILDSMDLERERGITIKLQAARVLYTSPSDNETYCLNLIDTPGHVDFNYEVSRSLAACEGALLVVDASQGIQAQTLANVYLALENNLEIIPILNKIDLPAAEPARVRQEIEDTIGLDCTDIVLASAKAGIGIEDILEAIVRKIPPPAPATPGGPFRALIFDSYYDSYRGVVVFFRVVDGQVSTRDKVQFLASGAEHEVSEVGVMQPQKVPVDCLRAGEVGYLWGNIKDVLDARVGDTIVLAKEFREARNAGRDPPIPALAGYAESVPMVYCGLFPVDADDYENLRDALGKLRLNDAALSYEPETSGAMGFGFRCGFLGLLHMEIIQERLQREYDLDLIVTAPSVVYKVQRKNVAEDLIVDAPSKMPELSREDKALEPYVRMDILTPSEYNGAIIELGQERRGELIDIRYLTPTRSTIVYDLPLGEVITDFFDQLKSRTKGYASMEYKIIDYRESDLVRLDVKINAEPAPALACIVHRDKAQSVGRRLCASLKELIPRQMFKIPIQACVGVKVIASEHISPMRKDVLAKCYGGDITRKKKLLQKQAKGKKRMKAIGKVNVPQEAFMAVLRINSESP